MGLGWGRFAFVAAVTIAPMVAGHAAWAAAPAGETRVALVVGISAYKPPVPKLPNPVSDATYVAEALRKEGFKVQVLTDPGRSELLEALDNFTEQSTNADAAIVYYAGHGVEVDGVNYLLPKDVRPPRDMTGKGRGSGSAADGEGDVSRAVKAIFTDTAIKAARARDAVVGASRVRLLILDACREDPFAKEGDTRGVSKEGGLARETGGSATRVVTLMAAAPGKFAYDGQAPHHSPFAEALVEAIQRPGMTIGDLPIAVQTGVEEATRKQETIQSPDQQGIFRDTRWSFSMVASTTTKTSQADAEAAAQRRLAREQAFWQTAKSSNDAADLRAYLANVDSGEFSGLFKPLALNRIRTLEAQQTAPPPVANSAGRSVTPAAAAETVAPQGLAARARARQAYMKGDYKGAVAAWTEAARAGDSAGAYNLGIMALTGRMGPKDMPAAARWFETAAKAGHPGGMENYGLCLLNGYGVAKNEAGGVQWIRKAADGGLPSSMALMAEVYLRGVGEKPNKTTGLDWLKRAADAGDGPATVRLAEIYETGSIGKPDLRRAFDLYRRAALAGQADAMVKVGYFYEDGTVEKPDLLQAATWYQRAADAGDAEGMSSLGVMLETGTGLVKDEAAAARYYGLAAERKDPRGLLGLGGLYARGAGVPQDDARAVSYFRQAADAGSVSGARNLGVMYEAGRGVPRDLNMAAKFYKQAADAGDTDAAADVARLSRR